MSKNKTLPWKTTEPNFHRFLCIDWDGFAYLFLKFELRSNFPETEMSCCQFHVQSCEPEIS